MNLKESQLSLSELDVNILPVQERVLFVAIRDSYGSSSLKGSFDTVTTTYIKQPTGLKHFNIELNNQDIAVVVDQFKNNPKHANAIVRNNLLAILTDPKETDSQKKKERLERYVSAYISLIEKLDRHAFPPQKNLSQVYRGVPDYIPDGLSDMGSDPTIDPRFRTREKIRVDKRTVYMQEKEFLLELFNSLVQLGYKPTDDGNMLEAMKKTIVGRICNHVYATVQYDYDQKKHDVAGIRSVYISEYDQEGVCRHIAMRAQLLMQCMGITSRLFKCDFDGMPHAANIVRINSHWRIVDPTNPLYRTNQPNTYVFATEHSTVNIYDIEQGKEIVVRIPLLGRQEKRRIYKGRNNMYYRILQNSK